MTGDPYGSRLVDLNDLQTELVEQEANALLLVDAVLADEIVGQLDVGYFTFHAETAGGLGVVVEAGVVLERAIVQVDEVTFYARHLDKPRAVFFLLLVL